MEAVCLRFQHRNVLQRAVQLFPQVGNSACVVHVPALQLINRVFKQAQLAAQFNCVAVGGLGLQQCTFFGDLRLPQLLAQTLVGRRIAALDALGSKRGKAVFLLHEPLEQSGFLGFRAPQGFRSRNVRGLVRSVKAPTQRAHRRLGVSQLFLQHSIFSRQQLLPAAGPAVTSSRRPLRR